MKIVIYNQMKGRFHLSEEGSRVYCQKKGIPFQTVTDEVTERFGGRTDPDLIEVVEQVEFGEMCGDCIMCTGDAYVCGDYFQVVKVADHYHYWTSDAVDMGIPVSEDFEEINVKFSDEILRKLCSDPEELISYVHGIEDAIPAEYQW